MRQETNDIIKALEVCSDALSDCKACPFCDYDANCMREIKTKAAAALKQLLSLHDAKDVIIEDLNVSNNMIRQENELLWRSRTYIDTDGNFCPVCGAMQFIADIGYCKVCGQALKRNEEFLPSEKGDEEESEVDMLSDINDRS